MGRAYRYLLNMSYIGTTFRGAQSQVKVNDSTTVQGNVEIALQTLKPVNYPAVIVSSRTDSGVHALHTTMHTDLERADGEIYSTLSMTETLNKHFAKNDLPIRVISSYQVPEEFNCRFANKRTYLYRLVIIDSGVKSFLRHIPIEDVNRAYYHCSKTFDVEKCRRAAKSFEGLHDFRTFMAREALQHDKVTRRTITRCEVAESQTQLYSPCFSWPRDWIKEEAPYDYYDIIIESSGFLYRQTSNLLEAVVARKRKLRATQTLVTHADGTQVVEQCHGRISTIQSQRVAGYVVDVQPDAVPALICDHLYLGSQDCVDVDILSNFSIRNVLSIGIATPAADALSAHHITVKEIPCLDLPETNIWETLEKCQDFIAQAIATKRSILVHCNAGVSRSPAIVIGFLMCTRQLSYQQAYDLVKSRRSAIKPNDGFVRQLAAMRPKTDEF